MQHDHMIEALAPNGTNHSLSIGSIRSAISIFSRGTVFKELPDLAGTNRRSNLKLASSEN
jgi:hypothetical protein